LEALGNLVENAHVVLSVLFSRWRDASGEHDAIPEELGLWS
jgi:hypothetical protein